MPDFDPYHKWLGISPQHQPPNHYRLLSLDLFEADPDVIEAAVDRIATFLQDVSAGPQAKESQQLLNEIATARLCLLDESRKSEYDQILRAEFSPASQTTEAPPVHTSPLSAAPDFAIDTGSESSAKSTTAPKPASKRPAALASKKPEQAKHPSGLLLLSFVSAGVLLIAAIAFAMLRGDAETRRRGMEDERDRERQQGFAELGHQPESMIPDFTASIDFDTARSETNPANKPAKKPEKNR